MEFGGMASRLLLPWLAAKTRKLSVFISQRAHGADEGPCSIKPFDVAPMLLPHA